MVDDPEVLVSTAWLAERLGAPGLRVLDASWYLPDAGRDPRAEYEAAHVPGARFVGLDAVSDAASPLPHTAPGADAFGHALAAAGVGRGDAAVVYDAADGGPFSAPRLWWLLRAHGVRAAVLDGGLRRWRAEGRPVEAGAPEGAAAEAPALGARPGFFRDADAVAAGRAQVVDARAAARFRGEAPEPRPGLRAGHVPGARSLPFPLLFRADGTMKDEAGLRAAFEAAGVALDRPVVTSCGSGVTAAIVNLALARLGHGDHALYDGSWSEWGLDPARPVETGEARA